MIELPVFTNRQQSLVAIVSATWNTFEFSSATVCEYDILTAMIKVKNQVCETEQGTTLLVPPSIFNRMHSIAHCDVLYVAYTNPVNESVILECFKHRQKQRGSIEKYGDLYQAIAAQ